MDRFQENSIRSFSHCPQWKRISYVKSLERSRLYKTPLHAICNNNNRCTALWWLIQVHLGEQVISQRKDLLEQPLDLYEPDVLRATHPIVSKHYRKTQWFGRLLFTDMVYQYAICNFDKNFHHYYSLSFGASNPVLLSAHINAGIMTLSLSSPTLMLVGTWPEYKGCDGRF